MSWILIYEDRFVTKSDGRTFPVELLSDATVYDLKEAVRAETGIVEDYQRLVHGREQLGDITNTSTVGEVLGGEWNVVQLLGRLRGGTIRMYVQNIYPLTWFSWKTFLCIFVFVLRFYMN